MAFGFRSFFRVPKHQQFEYKPRFYDPQKEELQERLAAVESRKQEGIEGAKNRIRQGIRRSFEQDESYRRRQVLRSNLIVAGIVVMLLVLGYMLLTIYLPQWERLLE